MEGAPGAGRGSAEPVLEQGDAPGDPIGPQQVILPGHRCPGGLGLHQRVLMRGIFEVEVHALVCPAQSTIAATRRRSSVTGRSDMAPSGRSWVERYAVIGREWVGWHRAVPA